MFDDKNLNLLKMSPRDAHLPEAGTLFFQVRLLLFFNTKNNESDMTRLLELSRALSASIISADANTNYCFISCDGNLLECWKTVTKKIILLASNAMQQYAEDIGTNPKSRIAYGTLAQFLLNLVESRKWGYHQIKGKSPSEYTVTERQVIDTLIKNAAEVVREFLAVLSSGKSSFFDVSKKMITSIKPGSQSIEVLIAATTRICTLLASTSPAALQLHASSLLEIPHLLKKVGKQSFSLMFSATGMWKCTISAARSAESTAYDSTAKKYVKPSDNWPSRFITGNLIDVGLMLFCSSGTGGSDLTLKRNEWIELITGHVTHLMPSWSNMRRIFETDPMLESQFSGLWSANVVHLLFEDLLGETSSDSQTPIEVPKTSNTKNKDTKTAPSTPAKKGFFARLREKVSGPSVPEGPVKVDKKARELQKKSQMVAWKAPCWKNGCNLYNKLLAKWSARAILSALAARSFLLLPLWVYLDSHMALLEALIEGTDCKLISSDVKEDLFSILLLFLQCYNHFLPVCDDNEFYVLEKPFSLKTVVILVELFTKLALRCSLETLGISQDLQSRVRSASRSVVLLLYDRNTRRGFCPAETWMVSSFKNSVLRESFKFDPNNITEVPQVIYDMPFIVSFSDRALCLRKLIETDRANSNMSDTKFGITIRRDFLLEDGLAQLAKLVSKGISRLKARLHVQFKNSEGLEEAGIDAGGVFKEFIDILASKGFNPDLGLFSQTDDNKLYPNPDSKSLFTPAECRDLYQFLGRIVAKAVYEGVVLPLPFADFFLNTILGRSNYVEDLKTLDSGLHRNLISLKEIDDVEDLCLTFSLETNKMGEIVTTNLIPNGSEIAVTNDNLFHYIALVSHMKLNLQFREQATYFISGFHDVLPPRWIGLFNRNELQQLISGLRASFDLQDLKDNIKYAGGYNVKHPVIKNLWKTLEEFDDKQKAAFLSFVTSSSKAPLLGFAHLHPPFCVRQADNGAKGLFGSIDRLPSASTCFNLLKLPPYKNKKELKEKLLYAITSGAGFELS
eukprot:TRINITY_DN8286_c0_g1_i1.p1 TRINITY_DN8286_c0_g1~~TRINITY_DN8286_c0_g1_i1.p1  ORF type:complete len:1104 (+),score=173.77 TRINITY_DN8286_c0_g1_i1:255-3314(+)